MRDHWYILGIERWTLRNRSVSRLPAGYAYQLWYQQKRVGLLLAQAAGDDPAISVLLKKIVKAVHCVPQGQWYPIQPDDADLKDLRFVITLGKGFLVRPGVPHLQSDSPERLLAEPSLKVQTWRTLQAVFDYLK